MELTDGDGQTNRLRYRWNRVRWANPNGHLARSAAAGTARLRSADQLLATAAEVCARGGGGCHPKAPGLRSLTPFITAGAAAEQAAFGRGRRGSSGRRRQALTGALRNPATLATAVRGRTTVISPVHGFTGPGKPGPEWIDRDASRALI
jgi:hypothetical protein